MSCQVRFSPVLLAAALMIVALSATTSRAVAGEADDLQSMIDRAKQGASDLERLDDHHAAREDVTRLRTWLDEAWRLRSVQKYDDVRDVLNRCDAQAEMIRQRIAAAAVAAEAAKKEAELKSVRDQLDKTRQALQAATLQKATLEAKTKK